MSASNAARLPEEVSNRRAAPLMAEFVNAVRLWDRGAKTTYVNEGAVQLGSSLVVADTELVSYIKSRLIKGKTVYFYISYTIGRFAV